MQEINNTTSSCIIQADKIQAQEKGLKDLSHLYETQDHKERAHHLKEGYLAPFGV